MSAMTLEQVRDWHREKARCIRKGISVGAATTHDRIADALDAYLTQPAQSVDVAAKDAEIERLTWANRQLLDGAASADRARLCSDLRAESAESRLAAANALLREAVEWNWLDEDAPQQAGVNAGNPSVMDDLYLKIQSHLQGAGDEA